MISPSYAGVNSDGVLLLHAATSLTYTVDTADYCGQSGLTNCADAVSSVTADPTETTVFFVFAAFPTWATPSVKGVTFGVNYSASDLVLLDSGTCADWEIPSVGWPASGTGTALTWENASHAPLLEIYWFAAYAYSPSTPTVFGLAEHPDQGSSFADDSIPPLLDPVLEFGQLGFGMPGLLPSCDRPDPDLTFVELADGTRETFMEQLRALRSDYGLRVLASIQPDGLYCRSNPEMRAALASDFRVSLVTNTTIPGEPPVTDDDLAPGDHGFARRVWNTLLAEDTPPDSGGGGFVNPGNGCLFESFNAPRDTPEEQTSTYLMGDVGISLLIMESSNSDPCIQENGPENWTASEKNSAVANITDRFLEFADMEPNSECSFHVLDSPTLETSVEPIQEPTGVATWRLEALSLMGFSGTNEPAINFAFNNARRGQAGTDWWYTIFLVRDVCDQDKRFPNGLMSFAGLHGPSVILLYINGDGPDYPAEAVGRVAVHETGHTFGARDEYNEVSSCDGPYGYLRAEHQNRTGCLTNDPCIMRDANQFQLCSYSRKQLGWHDSDGDEIFDPIDHPQATQSMFIGDQEPLTPGDRVDIYSGTTFVRGLPGSEWSSDFGRVLWDGIGFDGLARPPGSYEWTRNGSDFHTLQLDDDDQAPSITHFSVANRTGLPGQYWFNFQFQDSDTHSGRARGSVWSNTPGVGSFRILPHKFYVDTSVSNEMVSTPFLLSEYGEYYADLIVWDVGGGHTVRRTFQFTHAPTSDVAPPKLASSGLRLSHAGPRPAMNNLTWSLLATESGLVRLEIVGVDGRRMRHWESTVSANTPTLINWDGRTDGGVRVVAGRYFLIAKRKSGEQVSSEFTLIH